MQTNFGLKFTIAVVKSYDRRHENQIEKSAEYDLSGISRVSDRKLMRLNIEIHKSFNIPAFIVMFQFKVVLTLVNN